MATEREVSKQHGGWLPNSPTSLNAGTGWGAAAPSEEAKGADAATEPATGQQPHYLTTSGLFESHLRPSAREEAHPESASSPATQPSGLVDEFRSTVHQPQAEQDNQPRKNRTVFLALALFGILFVAATAGIYLYHPGKSAAEFHSAKTWMAKQWTTDLQQFSHVLHLQAAGQKDSEANNLPVLSAFLPRRHRAHRATRLASASLPAVQPKENTASAYLQIGDFYGRRWILTPAGEVFGPAKRFADLSALNPGALPRAPEVCQSLFYNPECP